MNSVLQSLLTSIVSSVNPTTAANLIGQHLQQQNNVQTSIRALIALATPANAASIATQIASLPGTPTTVTALLGELASAKDQATITAIGLQIEASLNANNGVFGSILASL